MSLQLVVPNVVGSSELIADEITTVPQFFHQPRVFTHALIGRLADINAASRAVRALGIRVVDEDPVPDDGLSPILQLDLNGMALDQFLNRCDASTHYADGRITGQFHGVRVCLLLPKVTP